MNGIHDLGGMDGFGAVEIEANEPVFHHAWEARVFGLVAFIETARLLSFKGFRHAIERMEPVHYLRSPYYEHWLTALATLFVERGLLTQAELDARAGGRFPLSGPLRVTNVPTAEPSTDEPRFAVCSAVRVRNQHRRGHTRCPKYVRGKRGVVVRIGPRSALPDITAHSEQKCRQFEYCVGFDSCELWGDDGAPGEVVHVDLWEDYLEAP